MCGELKESLYWESNENIRAVFATMAPFMFMEKLQRSIVTAHRPRTLIPLLVWLAIVHSVSFNEPVPFASNPSMFRSIVHNLQMIEDALFVHIPAFLLFLTVEFVSDRVALSASIIP